jgi:hypothetical protein
MVRALVFGWFLSLPGAASPAAGSDSPAIPNRTVPTVAPPPHGLEFSASPTASEISRARVFEEPLIPVGGQPSAAENAALAAALLGYAQRSGPDDFSSLTGFLEAHAGTPWGAALLTDLGFEYYNTAHYARALEVWGRAWALAKDATDPRGKAIGISPTLAGNATLTLHGTSTWVAGTMSGSGRTVIAPGATFTFANARSVTLDTRTLGNAGTVLWAGNGGLGGYSGAVITNRAGALFEAQNNASFTYIYYAACRFDNAGTFRKDTGTGTTTFSSFFGFNNYNTLDIRSGIVAANGGYACTANSTLACALGGTTAGTGYAQLQAAGTVTLNGALSVVLTNGYLPTTSDSFTVLTAGSRNGTFASFTYPSNQVTMQLSNATSSVIVQVTAVAPPPPLLLSPTLSGSNVVLTWTAVSNTTYRVEFNPNLNPSNWSAVPGDVTSLSNSAVKLDSLTPTNRFYRVRVVP